MSVAASGRTAPGLAPRAKGLALTVTGVLIMTPDALLIRLIGVEGWSLLIWRGGLMALVMTVLLGVQFRGAIWRGFAGFGVAGVMAALALGFTNVGFVISMTETKAAVVLVIFASVPLFGALLGWLGFGESVPARTWLAMPFAFLGIAVAAQTAFADGNPYGIAMAFGGTLMLACYLTLLRHAPSVNNYAATALGAAIAMAIGFGLGDPLAVMATARQFGYTLLLGLVVLPFAVALFSAGPKYISSAEVGLVLLLETALGPLWVWLVIAETPSPMMLVGGGIVVATLVVHSVAGLRWDRGR